MADRIQETELAYDSIAAEYATAASGRSAEAEEFFARFVDHLQPGGLVADLGCGSGADLARLDTAGRTAIGLDRSVELLRLAAGAPRTRADLTTLPFRGRSLDGIWSHASLVHVEATDLPATFAEWDRVLAPGGLLGMTTSLGAGDSGWESVPAVGSRVPRLARGHRRWFVHHDEGEVAAGLTARGWRIVHRSVRSSHRQWIQLIAAKPG